MGDNGAAVRGRACQSPSLRALTTPGSITAALFLKEFVSDTAWAHLDIAGPVWNEKAGGATGFGVRTLAAYAEAQAS